MGPQGRHAADMLGTVTVPGNIGNGRARASTREVRVESFDVSLREVRSAAKKLVGPAPRPDQVQLAALQAVLDIAEQPLSERERDAVDTALALARGALPAAAPLLDQVKCPTLASTVLSCATALSNFRAACCENFCEAIAC